MAGNVAGGADGAGNGPQRPDNNNNIGGFPARYPPEEAAMIEMVLAAANIHLELPGGPAAWLRARPRLVQLYATLFEAENVIRHITWRILNEPNIGDDIERLELQRRQIYEDYRALRVQLRLALNPPPAV